MATAGYSGIPLLQKLGIKHGMKVLTLNPPKNYFQLLQSDITKQYVSPDETPDFIHLFAETNTIFKNEMKKVLRISKKNSSVVVWISWYKKASGMATDLTEDLIRNFALENGFVDIKVCAISNEWSGLKLVVPVSKR